MYMSIDSTASSKVFHDAYTYRDENAHDSLVQSLEDSETENLPLGFKQIKPDTITQGEEGSLSSAEMENGDEVHFGAFVSDEGKFAASNDKKQTVGFESDQGNVAANNDNDQVDGFNSAQGNVAVDNDQEQIGGLESDQGNVAATNDEGKVLFFFKKSQESSLLDALKVPGLIPDTVNGFSNLGNRAIGVIENAVDEGVLTVTNDGQLEVANVPEDELGSDAPTVGANRVSETDKTGNIKGQEAYNDAGASNANGSSTATAAKGSTKAGGKGAGDTAMAITSDATEQGDGQASGPQASSGTGTNVATGSAQGGGSKAASGTGTTASAGGGQNGSSQAATILGATEKPAEGKEETQASGVASNSGVGTKRVAISGGGSVEVDGSGDAYVLGTQWLEADQKVKVSARARDAAGLKQDATAGDYAERFSDGRLGVVWPRDGSGDPTVVGASEEFINQIKESNNLETGPEMLDNAFSKNIIGHTDGVAKNFNEKPTTVNPTNGWALQGGSNKGDIKLTKNSESDVQSISVHPEALSTLGVKNEQVDEKRMRELMSSGNLAVVRIDGDEKVAVALSDRQSQILIDKGYTSLQDAYDKGFLGVNSGTGRAVIIDPDDSNKVIHAWEKVGSSAKDDALAYAKFTTNENSAA